MFIAQALGIKMRLLRSWLDLSKEWLRISAYILITLKLKSINLYSSLTCILLESGQPIAHADCCRCRDHIDINV